MQIPNPARHGWLIIPGIQPIGDRTVEEQMLGLDKALAECKGKTVLDLGCAEGAISLAFAKAGAKDVYGLDQEGDHLTVARYLCRDTPNVRFFQTELKRWVETHPKPEQFDIVLELGVIHKLHEPGLLARWAAKSARELLCFRAPGGVRDGVVRSKFGSGYCRVFDIMARAGFADEGAILNGRLSNESVHYFRRKEKY